jgi:hypothetical protein
LWQSEQKEGWWHRAQAFGVSKAKMGWISWKEVLWLLGLEFGPRSFEAWRFWSIPPPKWQSVQNAWSWQDAQFAEALTAINRWSAFQPATWLGTTFASRWHSVQSGIFISR